MNRFHKTNPAASLLAAAASLAVMLIVCFSCKKSKEAPALQTDFREPYKGTFLLARDLVAVSIPAPPAAPDTVTSTYYAMVTISYALTDSITFKTATTTGKMSALSFNYGGTQQEYLGIDAAGHLYRTPDTNDGGFITKDSIYLTSAENTAHYREWLYIHGKRQ